LLLCSKLTVDKVFFHNQQERAVDELVLACTRKQP